MNKIIIIPTFASSHFLRTWIPNVQEILEPDLILIREAFFELGPENKGFSNLLDFKNRWLFPNTNAGFDWKETQEICKNYSNIILENFNPTSRDANLCFLEAIARVDEYAKTGSMIFVLEPDVFIHENDKDKIIAYLNQLNPGEGYRIKWIDFLETQYYTEFININHHKIRRFVYCWDNLKNFLTAMNGFMTQDYPKLKKISDLFLFHYPWFVYGKWKQLRYELIYRSNPQYWADFEKGLQEIRRMSIEWKNINDPWESACFDHNDIEFHMEVRDKILIRPSRQDEGRWAKFIDVPHPKAIQSHPNFVK